MSRPLHKVPQAELEARLKGQRRRRAQAPRDAKGVRRAAKRAEQRILAELRRRTAAANLPRTGESPRSGQDQWYTLGMTKTDGPATAEDVLLEALATLEAEASKAISANDFDRHMEFGAAYHRLARHIIAVTGKDPRPADPIGA